MDVSSIVARRSLEAFHRFPRRIKVRPRSICTDELVCVKRWLLRLELGAPRRRCRHFELRCSFAEETPRGDRCDAYLRRKDMRNSRVNGEILAAVEQGTRSDRPKPRTNNPERTKLRYPKRCDG
jgi:hypothetical protein